MKWDLRFIELAAHVARWSKDPSTQVGAVLVSPDRSQVILGYNGFPRGVDDDPELYGSKEEKYKRVVHAELNAILNSPCRPLGWTLYVYPLPPCTECTKAIIQSGVGRVVYVVKGELKEHWQNEFATSIKMYDQAGIKVENRSIDYEREWHAKHGPTGFTSIARDCC